ncbi:HET-domain-containing protein [Glonium stellatum]|uniref:HET-domain-containing protein n=1 Tax=Glonium stellatum TaxID=574774 RepID=A0A8E2FAK7_9PEZI|nr:HET-domain-containing protein [Glonium stellatum]
MFSLSGLLVRAQKDHVLEVELSGPPRGLLRSQPGVDIIEFHRMKEHQHQITRYKAIGIASCISGDTSSKQASRQAKRWLRDCMANHPGCNFAQAKARQSPTRLIQLKSTSLDGWNVRLYEPKQESVEYACLSHCWGDIQPLRTTQNCFKQFKQVIEWDKLPRTFQDAVSVARSLKVHYIWIDSLCIIQDSQDDWGRECGQMARIYQNAVVTIAAMGASNSTGGCFSTARQSSYSYKIADCGTPKQPDGIFIRQKIKHIYDVPGTNKQSFPLLSRAWFFQERLHSSRLLHFCSEELVWECRERHSCECFGACFHDTGRVTRKKPKSSFVNDQIAEDLKKEWSSFINAYSKLNLTFESDYLPALSGTAQEMQRQGKGRYLAGLWEDSLLQGLLWRPADENRPMARPKNWRAPTWSWASVVGPVTYGDRKDLNASSISGQIGIIDVRYKPAGVDPTGEAASASLIVSARIVPLMLGFCRNKPAYTLELLQPHTSDHFVPDFDLGFPVRHSKEVHAMRLFREGYSTAYLVLLCLDKSRQTYERIGFAMTAQEYPNADNFGTRLGRLFNDANNERIVTIV